MQRRAIAFFLLVAAQATWLVGFAVAEETGMRSGEEVVLQTVPVDPRDLLRGDYVTLAYEISRPSDDAPFAVGDTVYVRLERSGSVWSAAGVADSLPDSWDVAIRGRVASAHPFTVEYGIEAYFVPEGRGHEIERAGDVKAGISLESDGTARLSYLIVDGERWDPSGPEPQPAS